MANGGVYHTSEFVRTKTNSSDDLVRDKILGGRGSKNQKECNSVYSTPCTRQK